MGFFKTHSEKEVKRIMPIVNKINEMEMEISKLSDKDLRAKTEYFKQELINGKTIDDILPEAFAVMRESAKRVLEMRHFDVQLIGGIMLHQGRISEMKTGEGKTLVATLPAYLNALDGKGVHIVTVNDYLAKRDSEWMGKVFRYLGLSVGLAIAGMDSQAKREAYNSDITYCTNNELGFDYLRDNMVIYKNQLVQRELNYAIIDEIDSILVDEARTPLIISGRGEQSSDLYKKANSFVGRLSAKVLIEEDAKDEEQAIDNENYDYIVDLKAKSTSLTLKGIEKAEKEFGLTNFNDIENSELVHNVNQALRAYGIMKKDIDYIVKDGEVLIIDEFTGRIMQGRRYSNGLHQAIEAKERVKIADESKTLATITFQNYFRMYNKLSGMTGTAMTEKDEFEEIYKLDVLEIPTNKELARLDQNDIIYKNEISKFRAVIADVKESNQKGQPVLIGTVSINKSEILSKLLTKEGIKHTVLNAKFHEKEAEIIAQAGKYGAVTIATNMAGRGTDIMLGGNSEYLAKQEMKRLKFTAEQIEQSTAFNETQNEDILKARVEFKKLQEKYSNEIKEEKEKVINAGGLKIIGTQRHESRRIDNQLRGRSGRQGDVGETRFYIGLDDDLMKIFGGDMITKVYNSLGAEEDMPIELKLISNTVEKAQKKVESKNFSIRKNVLQYDDVMNTQRGIIYSQRKQVLDGENMDGRITSMITSLAEELSANHVNEFGVNKETLSNEALNIFGVDNLESLNKENISKEEVSDELKEKALKLYELKETEFGVDHLRELERVVMLKIVDERWMTHIDEMDELKSGIGLRAYGQKDPVVQYRLEGFDMFDQMIEDIKLSVVTVLMNAQKREGDILRKKSVKVTSEGREIDNYNLNKNIIPNSSSAEVKVPYVNKEAQVGRNEPCSCGSGKKHKNCCGKAQ